MSLLECPNEVLTEILQLSRPYDFENLVLTCKLLHAVASRFLPRHNELRRRYRRFELAYEFEEGYTVTIPELLLDIADEPIIADYIVHADLSRRTCTAAVRWTSPADYRDLVRRTQSEAAKQKLLRLVLGSRLLLESAPEVNFVDLVDHIVIDRHTESGFRVDISVAFLLTLLRNVETLSLPIQWSHDSPRSYHDMEEIQQHMRSLMYEVVEQANDGQLPGQALAKLRTVFAPVGEDGYCDTTLLPILALGSLEVAHQEGYAWYGSLPESSNLLGPLGMNLKAFKLEDCSMLDVEAEIYFKDMQRLEHLVLGPGDASDVTGEQVYRFYSCISKHVGHRLKSLSWTGLLVGGDETAHSRAAFEVFNKLEHLEIDLRFFLLCSYNPCTRSRDYERDEDKKAVSSKIGGAYEAGTTGQLHNMLPASLRSLVLHIDASYWLSVLLEDMLQGFSVLRRTHLPVLEEVRVVVCRQGWHGDPDVPVSSPLITMTREFCERVGDIEFRTKKESRAAEYDT